LREFVKRKWNSAQHIHCERHDYGRHIERDGAADADGDKIGSRSSSKFNAATSADNFVGTKAYNFNSVAQKKRSRHWGERRLRVKHGTKLEREFGSELQLPRRLAGRDLAEAAASYRRGWIRVIDAVERVKGIEFDHESHALDWQSEILSE
jgi:hypothetical protein